MIWGHCRPLVGAWTVQQALTRACKRLPYHPGFPDAYAQQPSRSLNQARRSARYDRVALPLPTRTWKSRFSTFSPRSTHLPHNLGKKEASPSLQVNSGLTWRPENAIPLQTSASFCYPLPSEDSCTYETTSPIHPWDKSLVSWTRFWFFFYNGYRLQPNCN